MIKNKNCKLCGKASTSNCDSCNERTCRECSIIVVEKPTAVEINLYHKGKCTPLRFRKEVKE